VVTDAQPGLAPTHGLPAKDTSPRETLRVRLKDPVQNFFVTLCYRLTPEHDIIERWLELENAGQATVSFEVCNFASLHLPNDTNELTYVSGTWRANSPRSANDYRRARTSSTAATCKRGTLPTRSFFLTDRDRRGGKAARCTLRRWPTAAHGKLPLNNLPTWHWRVHAGYHSFDFQLDLAPGEKHITPALVSGVSPEAGGGASRRLHAFTQERVLRRRSCVPCSTTAGKRCISTSMSMG